MLELPWWGRAAGVAGLWLLAALASGDDLPALRVGPAPALQVGAHAVLPVELELGPSGARPVMLTLRAEGETVAVVRGRLLRGDALDPEAAALRFEVPLLARAEGRTVVRLRADAYLCSPRCEPVRLEESIVLEVRR